jgi:hypothetical protein
MLKLIKRLCIIVIGVIGGVLLIFLLNDLFQTAVEYFKYRTDLRKETEERILKNREAAANVPEEA